MNVSGFAEDRGIGSQFYVVKGRTLLDYARLCATQLGLSALVAAIHLMDQLVPDHCAANR